MGLELHYENGQTPLDPEEIEGLKVKMISTKAELDQFEQYNIEQCLQWLADKSVKVEKVFTELFLQQLHKRMFGDVWSWAGSFRRTDKNIGVAWHTIPMELKQLLGDARYWYEHQVYQPIEMAARVKHRLVSIHCFANGNGRHSRLYADVLVQVLYDLPYFKWGSADLSNGSEVRTSYIKALKSADKGDYDPLIEFLK